MDANPLNYRFLSAITKIMCNGMFFSLHNIAFNPKMIKYSSVLLYGPLLLLEIMKFEEGTMFLVSRRKLLLQPFLHLLPCLGTTLPLHNHSFEIFLNLRLACLGKKKQTLTFFRPELQEN